MVSNLSLAVAQVLLDYIPKTGAFVLRVPRGEGDLKALMTQVGLDFSEPDSTPAEAILFTREPCAALCFWDCATPAARKVLGDLNDAVERSWAISSRGHIRVPDDKELWPFQTAGVEYALRQRNSLIGDQPGLGKTPQAICIANEMVAKRVLVVCPANIRLQWIAQIKAWSVMRKPFLIYPVTSARMGVHPSAPWTIVSYDLARNPAIHHALLEGHYDLLIIDEGHYLKTTDTGRTRALFGGGGVAPLAAKAEQVVVLTGTPLPNRPRECYTLARALCWESIDWLSEEKFKLRFNPSITQTREKVHPETGNIYQVRFVDERTGRLGELQNRLRSSFMVRRLKKDVLTQLPSVMHEIVHVEETAGVRKAREAEDLLHIDPDKLEFNAPDVIGMWPVVRRQMGEAIAPLAADYVDTLVDGGVDKVVLFAWHISVLDILETSLAQLGVVRVDGSTPMHARQKRVDEFRDNPACHIFLGNMLAIGVGLDGLQDVASHAVFAEYSTVPGDNQQAIDRLHRIGQKSNVLAQFLLAPNSLGERIIEKWLTKLQTIHASLDKEYV